MERKKIYGILSIVLILLLTGQASAEGELAITPETIEVSMTAGDAQDVVISFENTAETAIAYEIVPEVTPDDVGITVTYDADNGILHPGEEAQTTMHITTDVWLAPQTYTITTTWLPADEQPPQPPQDDDDGPTYWDGRNTDQPEPDDDTTPEPGDDDDTTEPDDDDDDNETIPPPYTSLPTDEENPLMQMVKSYGPFIGGILLCVILFVMILLGKRKKDEKK